MADEALAAVGHAQRAVHEELQRHVLQLGLLISGAVLTETVFAFNGIGRFLAQAIFQLDFPVLQGFIIFIALLYSLINLVVDVSYGLIDPRVRVS